LVITVVALISFILITSLAIDLFVLLGYSPATGEGESPITSLGIFLVTVVAMAVMPAVSEEIAFRGMIQKDYEKEYGPIVAIIASSVMFSLIHMSPSQTVFQLIVGLIWAWVYFRTRNLVYPMIMHFLNNLIAVSLMYFLPAADPAYLEPSSPAVLIIIAFGLAIGGTVALIALIKQFPKAEQAEDTDAAYCGSASTEMVIAEIKRCALEDAKKNPQMNTQKEKRPKFLSSKNWVFYVFVLITSLMWLFSFFA